MIRHLVAIHFKQAVTEAEIVALMDALGGLQGHLQGIRDYQYRLNTSPEDKVVHGLWHLFWFDFDTEADRDAYLVDAQHRVIGAKLVEAAEGGTDGIVVLDFAP